MQIPGLSVRTNYPQVPQRGDVVLQSLPPPPARDMTPKPEVRDLLAQSFGWSEAHASFDDAVRDLPVHLRGARPAGLAHSPWELLEHIRITQRDILDFSLAAHYGELEWPSGY